MNNESQDIIKSFTVVKEMLNDRNIDISNLESYSENEIEVLISASNGSGTKNGNIFQIKVNDDMKIIYHMKNKFIKNDLKKFLSTIEKDEDYKHIIFIFKEKINNNNEKNIKELLEGVTYELFPIKNLLFNITKHSYVPKHELLSVDEANNIMKIYSIKNKSQFPIILKSDPVARYYDFKPGQLIKVYRSSTATGESITYRYCV
jgi:DNA-directed RNA polymerase I, II, and III subunit RPABC1